MNVASRTLFTLIVVAVASASQAAPITDVQQIGPHHRLFRFDKNENPQNVMYAFSRTDSECRFQRPDGKPVVDFYWMLDGSRYKKPHPLIKSGIAKRIRFLSEEKPTKNETDAFAVRLVPTNEMKSDLENAVIRVSSSKSNGACVVKTTAKFDGPEGETKTIQLAGIKADTKKLWHPPFRKVVAITLRGSGVGDGREITQVFD